MKVYTVLERWSVNYDMMVQSNCSVFSTREKADEYARKAAEWFIENEIEGGRIKAEPEYHDYEVENDDNEWLDIDIEEKWLQ